MSRSGHTHGFPDEEPDWLARIAEPSVPWWRRKVYSYPEYVFGCIVATIVGRLVYDWLR